MIMGNCQWKYFKCGERFSVQGEGDYHISSVVLYSMLGMDGWYLEPTLLFGQQLSVEFYCLSVAYQYVH